MKQKYFLLFILLFSLNFSVFAQHTFSIVAVDPATGEIGSAGATCISREDGAQIISDIVLGVGAIHTQSYWSSSNQTNARARMVAGDSPQEIMNWLVAHDAGNNPSIRQYLAVDLNNGTPRSAAYTGSNCYDQHIHKTGANYAIAGNILISQDVVNDMETAFLNATGTLADKLMAALQGAKRVGADSRCQSYGISSASAFLRVASPNDTDSSYGHLSLDLNVWITSTIFEPIDALQNAYNDYLGISENKLPENDIVLYPNPVKDVFTVRSPKQNITSYEIVDISGKLITKQHVSFPKNSLVFDVAGYEKGMYLINIFSYDKKIAVKKIIVK